jgi:hypothetical protein
VRGRVWILLGLAVLAILVGSVPVFRDNSNESHAASYADVLKQRYPGWNGFSTCVPTAVQGQLDC